MENTVAPKVKKTTEADAAPDTISAKESKGSRKDAEEAQ
jgi:hypothetical protein